MKNPCLLVPSRGIRDCNPCINPNSCIPISPTNPQQACIKQVLSCYYDNLLPTKVNTPFQVERDGERNAVVTIPDIFAEERRDILLELSVAEDLCINPDVAPENSDSAGRDKQGGTGEL